MTRPPSPSSYLRRLVAASRAYGGNSSATKQELLGALEKRRLATAREVHTLHDVLCFLRAYPDDRPVLAIVERMLEAFHKRSDLRRARGPLADSGIAGTRIHYRFYWPVANWVAKRWPDRLELNGLDREAEARLDSVLPQLVTRPEAEALKRLDWSGRRKLQCLLAPKESDGAFVVKRIDALAGDTFTREALHDGLDLEYRLEPGPTTPSRTHARHRPSPVVFRETPPSRKRPDLARELRRPPDRVRLASPREGRRLIDLALEAMVTRSRDLEAFGYGDPRDVRVAEDGDGLEFACIGVLPERRRLLHATYAYLTLSNGVPIGYVQVDALFRSAGISFNTFESFRGAEAARVFGRMLALTRHLFGTDSFSIEPYQLGHKNAEALDSGAWWFYYKLGFRPLDTAVKRLAASELKKIARDRRYRSPRRVLAKLATEPLFRTRGTAAPVPAPPWDLGLVVARELASRGGADRKAATASAVEEARRLLGLRTIRGWKRDERTAFMRWSPLVLALPGINRWNSTERRALVDVIRSKAARHETEFVRRFDDLPCLGRAVLELASIERP